MNFSSEKLLPLQFRDDAEPTQSLSYVSAPYIISGFYTLYIMANFTHLHVHSQFSILDGAAHIKNLIEKAVKDNMTAVAITDHGNLYGTINFYNAAKAAGIKPIIGYEAYVAATGRFEKKSKESRGGDHLIILAKNEKGYKNLIKLASLAFIEGLYYKPRIDKELLEQCKEGLIISSACLGGEIPRHIMNDRHEEAEKSALWYKNVFGDDFYLELMRHKSGNPVKDKDVYNNQVVVNDFLVKLSTKHNIKIIATNDCHFINQEDTEAHDRLICINTGKFFDEENRMRYTTKEYFRTQQEMSELFNDLPEAIENTMEIANKVEEYTLDHAPIMPDFPLPEGFTNEDEYLKHITYEGAKIRYPEMDDETKERIDFELSVIKKMGFPGYFLIVWDILEAARKMHVIVGPGRGSAAGSVVSYCLKITDIDPIKYQLLFERFLNPDRISMPDIDIDFDDDGRTDVLDWVVEKYGSEKVAHIITFGTMAAKMAIRDVSRIHRLPLNEADKLAKLVPEGPKVKLASAIKEVPELKQALHSNNKLISETLKYAGALEGSVRHTGVHACGVIIGKNNLIEHIPICRATDTKLNITQFDGGNVEQVGMLKMDFLGLKTLSIIRDAVSNVNKSKGIDIDIDKIPFDDTKTFELYSSGDTVALFQFESPGMQKYLKALKPNKFEDLIAMNALYRPGPMEYIPSFVKRKHGQEDINYDLPEMEEYLKDTYGITVYQEQVMLLSQKLAGFTKGQADSLRKAMGKKKKKLMDELKTIFDEGCINNGHDKKITDKIWHDWEAFAEYAFNKSHSTCYAYLSYQTAYLKAHHPAEFMAAVLSRNLSDIKKVTFFMEECKRMGLEVLGPNVNESSSDFTVNSKGYIRFGLGGIKGVGETAVHSIIEERTGNEPFSSIFDFTKRVDLRTVNKKCIESLVYAGAFDNFENAYRSQYFFKEKDNDTTFLEKIIKFSHNYKQQLESMQQSLFGDISGVDSTEPEMPVCEKWPKLQKLKEEKNVIGFYLSGHPLDDFQIEMQNLCNIDIPPLKNNLKNYLGHTVKFAGIITEANHRITKNGKPYGSFIIEDFSDSIRIMLFSENYMKNKHLLEENIMLLVHANVAKKKWSEEEEIELKVGDMSLLPEALDRHATKVSLSISINDINDEFITDTLNATDNNKGSCRLCFEIHDPVNNRHITLPSKNHKVDCTGFIKTMQKKYKINYKIN